MSSWLIIAVLIALIVLSFKMRHVRHRFYLITLIVLLIFTYTTVSGIVKNNNIDVSTMSGMVTAGKVYFNWLGHLFNNTKGLVGNAVKMDWVGNSTLK